MKYTPRIKPYDQILHECGFKKTHNGWVKYRARYIREGIIKKERGKVVRVHCHTKGGFLNCHCDIGDIKGKHETDYSHPLLIRQKTQFISSDESKYKYLFTDK
jgi:hypothetical protein